MMAFFVRWSFHPLSVTVGILCTRVVVVVLVAPLFTNLD